MIWGPQRRRDTRSFGSIQLALVGGIESAIFQVSGSIDAPVLQCIMRIPSANVENFWTQNVSRDGPHCGIILWLATLSDSSNGATAETTVKIFLGDTSNSQQDDRSRRRGGCCDVHQQFHEPVAMERLTTLTNISCVADSAFFATFTKNITDL